MSAQRYGVGQYASKIDTENSAAAGGTLGKANLESSGSGGLLVQYEYLQPRLSYVAADDHKPMPTAHSEAIPVRDLSQPAHRYPHFNNYRPGPLQSNAVGLQTAGISALSGGKSPQPLVSPLQSGRRVNSKSQAKAAIDVNHNGSVYFAGAVSPPPRQGPPPLFVGSSFSGAPNAPHRPLLPLPASPTVPRPYPALDVAQFQQTSPQLHNRSASGRLLGSPPKRFADPKKVPYMPAADEPLGPDNPFKEIDDIWTACWDDEARAVYYYNKQSGEATWLPPE